MQSGGWNQTVWIARSRVELVVYVLKWIRPFLTMLSYDITIIDSINKKV